MLNGNSKKLLLFVKSNPSLSSSEIYTQSKLDISYATVKRLITNLIMQNLLLPIGKGRGTKYIISPVYNLFYPIDVEEYFKNEIDEREINDSFDLSIISDVLSKTTLFTGDELSQLTDSQMVYERNISELSDFEYQKELERLAIDLSWKSSEIEGNTYTLLETERLLKEKETAEGKLKDEAIMLLNHKDALDFIVANPNYAIPLTVSKIEDIHSILIKDLCGILVCSLLNLLY